MRKINVIVGDKYNLWEILKETTMQKNQSMVLARCDCGTERILSLTSITKGESKSCGCVRNKKLSEMKTTHGLCRHPLFKVWCKMRRRCYDKNIESYPYYGGKGVTVCDIWRDDFKSFYDWAIVNGWQKHLFIDKDIIPYKLGILGLIYSPETCCFVTRKENMRMRSNSIRVNYKGEDKSVSEWCEIFNQRYGTVISRLERGLCFEKSFGIY